MKGLRFRLRVLMPMDSRVALCVFLAMAVSMARSPAWAHYVFGPTLSYDMESRDNHSVAPIGSSDVKTLSIDLRLGYQFSEKPLFIGGTYKLEDSSFTGGDFNGFAFGPSIGLVKHGLGLIATYHWIAERNYTLSGVESRFMSGKGWQLDLSYTPEVSSGIGLGPQISFRSTKYMTSKVGAQAETEASLEVTNVSPRLAFWFVF